MITLKYMILLFIWGNAYLYCNCIFHELGHFIMACVLKIAVNEIGIGNGILLLQVLKVKIYLGRPSGYIDFDVSNTNAFKSKFNVILFYMSGCFANCIIWYLCFIFLNNTIYSLLMSYCSIFLLLKNLNPWFDGSDMKEMIKYLKSI